MDTLQYFLDVSANAPPECDGRYFRTWHRVSVQVQRAVRSFAVRNVSARDIDRAFTMVVFSASQPSHGRRPMEFTYDIGDEATIPLALKLIGRNVQARLAPIAATFQNDARLARRFAPVWHRDILNSVKAKPRLLINLLGREAAMINALIDLGTMRDDRTARRFLKNTFSVARVLRVESTVLLERVLRTGTESLLDGGIFEHDDVFPTRRPDAGIGGHEDRHHGSPDGRGQMTDARIISDVHACL